MAERYAVASGNWSAVATWDGGVSLPTTGDTVHPNGFTVTVDQNVTVDTLTNAAGVTASAGGSFNLLAGTVITANLQTVGGTLCTDSGSGTVSVVGDITATTSTSTGIVKSGSGTLNITGDLESVSAASNLYAVLAYAGAVNITGDITGNKTIGGGGPTFRNTVKVYGNCALTVVGDVDGGAASASILVDDTATLDFTGTVSGGNAGSAILQSSSSNIEITGNLVSATRPAIVNDSTGTGAVVHRGDVISGTAGIHPVNLYYAPYLIDSSQQMTHTYRIDDGGIAGDARSLYTGGTDIGNPATTDVRSGTTFGPASEYTGSLAVPDAQYVSQGVSVDATVGTLAASSSLASGTAQSGTSTTIQLAASESFADDILNGNIVKITGGTGAGQSRMISDYVGSTDTATVGEAWATTPDNSSTYEIVEGPHIDLSALATAASIAALNDVAATDIVSNGPITTSGGAVSNVTTVATTTTNTDMRGTDSALLAASAPLNFADLAITVTTGEVTVGINNDKAGYSISGTKTTLDDLNDVSTGDVNAQCDTAITDAALATAAALATVGSNVDAILVDTGTTLPAAISALNDISVADILTTQMTESYAADGVAPTLTQAVMLIQQGLLERNVFQTTETVRKLDKTTAAATYTLNDAANPTDKTRAT